MSTTEFIGVLGFAIKNYRINSAADLETTVIGLAGLGPYIARCSTEEIEITRKYCSYFNEIGHALN
jgi:hypothetical protein